MLLPVFFLHFFKFEYKAKLVVAWVSIDIYTIWAAQVENMPFRWTSLGCSATETSWNIEILYVARLTILPSRERIT